MGNTQKPAYFGDALWEVKQEILRLQIRFDEYDKAREGNSNHPWAADTPRERGAVRRASLDLSAALVKLRKASV
jgi:hypothetical protein